MAGERGDEKEDDEEEDEETVGRLIVLPICRG